MSDRMLRFEARPDIPSFERVFVWRSVCIWFGNFILVLCPWKPNWAKSIHLCVRRRVQTQFHSLVCSRTRNHHRWRWRGGTASVEPWRLKTIARTYVFGSLSVRAFACLTKSRVCHWQTHRHTKIIKRKKETKTTSFKTEKRERTIRNN